MQTHDTPKPSIYPRLLGSLGAFLILGALPACDAAAPSGEPAETTTFEIVNGAHDYLFVETQLAWILAKKYCAQVGHLVTIGDNLENEFVRAQAEQHRIGQWWIGRSDVARETYWVWENNEALRYDNWLPGQPDDVNHSQNCAYIDTATGQWGDADCNIPLDFICERDTGPAPLTQSFIYNVRDTNTDTQKFVAFSITNPVERIVTVGTCGLPGVFASGDTFLRVFTPGKPVEWAANDDACGGRGSNFSFVAQVFGGNWIIHAGCYGTDSCSGFVGIRVE